MTTILAGDLGGTKTLLALYESDGGALRQRVVHRYASAEWSSLGPMLQDFLGQRVRGHPRPRHACMAVAGPVRQGSARITNLPWQLREDELAAAADLEHLELVNDFAVLIYGLPHLNPAQQVCLQPGGEAAERTGPVAILGAGTGLGMARGVRGPDGLQALPSEGGHREFAPRTEAEWRLSCWMRRHLDLERLSVERIASGTGLGWIFLWLLEQAAGPHPLSRPATAWREGTAADPGRPDLPALVGAAAEEGDRLAVEARDLWLAAYGSAAGDLALHELATGGLWIGGGTAAKQVQHLGSPTFLEPFRSKGRFRPLMEQLPVRALTEPEAGLFSAACRARQVGH